LLASERTRQFARLLARSSPFPPTQRHGIAVDWFGSRRRDASLPVPGPFADAIEVVAAKDGDQSPDF
jgi:hypothetical protein